MKSSPSSNLKTLLTTLFALILTLIVLLFTKSFNTLPNSQPVAVDPELSDSVETIDWKTSITSQTLTLRDLQFILPENWQYKSTVNDFYPIEAYQLKPKEPIESFPVFEIRAETEKITLNELKNKLLNAWKADLNNPQVANIRISKLPGIQITAQAKHNYNSPFRAGELVTFTAFVHNDTSYIFRSNVPDYQKQYNQILSTFKFLDNIEPKRQVCPDSWIDFLGPIQSMNSPYFGQTGQFLTLPEAPADIIPATEFDLDWIKTNCSVSTPEPAG